jgi:hypothetical protein
MFQAAPNATSASYRRFPGFLALLCTGRSVYLTRHFDLWRLDLSDGDLRPLSGIPVSLMHRQVARFRLLRRLGRLYVRELIQHPGGTFIGAVQKRIVRFDPHGQECRTVLQVVEGGRPKGFALTPSGAMFAGEYWSNPRRQGLRLWASTDAGNTWEVAHRLPPGSAKHIHSLVWDPYREGLWVLTGDGEGECALLFTGDEFRTVTEVVGGGQMLRACQLFCRPEGLYYGTDTERAANWFVFLDLDRLEPRKIQPLPGSCLYAARMANRYFLSTSVEPSKINRYRNTVLCSSVDLQQWGKVAEFSKDWWPGEYFGFGSIILPLVQGDCPILIYSAIAVQRADFTTFLVDNGENNVIG